MYSKSQFFLACLLAAFYVSQCFDNEDWMKEFCTTTEKDAQFAKFTGCMKKDAAFNEARNKCVREVVGPDADKEDQTDLATRKKWMCDEANKPKMAAIKACMEKAKAKPDKSKMIDCMKAN